MASNDRALRFVTHLALAADGALAGIAIAYAAFQAYISFKYNSSALHNIRNAQSIGISDLLTQQQSDSNGKLVIIRGIVDSKSNMLDGSTSTKPLISCHSGEQGVVLEKTQTCIYRDHSKGFFGWARELHFILGNNSSWTNPKATSLTAIPFVLVGGTASSSSSSSYVSVDLQGSSHPLPLTTVHHQLLPLPTSPYTFFQALSGHSYPIGLLDEEKLLPLGKEITAVGICHGDPLHIKSCKDLPYFLSDITKHQMLHHLSHNTNLFFRSSILLGSMSLCVLGYAFNKNWHRWKHWLQQRRLRHARMAEIANEIAQTSTHSHAAEESEDVPDRQLCVICLTRRKSSAFVPCGHFVCCYVCALMVERNSHSKCPLCRQTITTSVRIYNS